MEKIVGRDGTEVITYEFPYMRRADKRTNWEKFRQGCYNPDEGSFLGRQPSAWARVALFYLVFYTVLASLFTICMYTMLSTIDKEYPKWQLEDSIIGTNPGLGFRPIADNTEEGSLIWFDAKNETEVAKWTTIIDEFLAPYKNRSQLPSHGENQMFCDYETGPNTANRVCAVAVEKWGSCTSQANYGFGQSAPCVFLKLNRIYNWVPDYYDDVATLPEDMPMELKDHIQSLKPDERKQIWVSCQGENPVDRENLGPVEMYPSMGFAGYYYPFRNQRDYLSPLVAVQFKRPTVGRLINVECRAWARNIIYRGGNKDRQGSVHFELMID
ncbi:sodium/potassium-transporting ATPase subunit beta-1-like [Ctenocephalides felis]|uniref:sodium/potassium-transporting ATPase subunit beta-1-like n=1 Tax=Ctenocephalides felis TaxID=7515 RepID=UPI000E6E2558|nr:sodium/potassium-transporting ATPase subunit beta-1-like [Ctenocephalides felis]